MTNNPEQNKELEKLFFEEFLSRTSFPIVGEISQPKQDPPDIVFTTGHEKIAVEITRYFSGSKEQETLQDKAVDEARKIYVQERTNPSVRLMVQWNRDLPLKSSETSWYAEMIVETVARFIPESGSELCLGQTLEEIDLLPPKIDELFIRRTVVSGDIIWNSKRGAWLPSLCKEELETIILKKSKQAEKYAGTCDRIWLLIIAEGNNPSSWYKFPQEVREHSFNSVFHDAFFFDMFTKEIISLRMSRNQF
jgi:hypothetical protein